MKKFLLMAAAAATLLASCAKEDNGDNVAVDGGAARMGLTFTLPTDAFTRANNEQDAIDDDEITVQTVDVYVFDTDGIPQEVGFHKSFNAATEFTRNGMTYTQTTPFETISGNVRIYVGINMPAATAVDYGTESELLEAIALVADMDETDQFTMFSAVVEQELDAYDETTPNVQVVPVSVGRVVSKVVGTAKAASLAADKWPNDVVLTYTFTGYNVYNEALDSYLVQQATTKSTLSTFDDSYAKGNKTITELNAWTSTQPGNSDDALKGLTGFYIGENNAKVADLSLNGNTTYAMVSAKITASATAKWDAASKSVKWDGGASDPGTDKTNGDDLYIVKWNGQTFICKNANHQDLVDGLVVALTEGPLADAEVAKGSALTQAESDAIVNPIKATIKSYMYPKSYVHFQVWLNKEGTNDYVIGRNQYIHLHVTGIKGVNGRGEGVFPGYPGDPTDPEKPINPTDVTDPNNPDPKQPDEPVDGALSQLKVEVSILPWNYKPNSVVLE